MIVVTCRVELYLPDAHSLKDKRQAVKSLIGRIRSRINASAAEVDYHDLWQRSAIGIAMVGTDKAVLEGQISLIERLADETEGAEAVEIIVDYV